MMKNTQTVDAAEIETVTTETESAVVKASDKAAIVAILAPVLERIPARVAAADALTVETQADADAGVILRDAIREDEKAVGIALDDRISLIHKLHRRWTGLRSMFTDPLKTAGDTVNRKIKAWQEEERLRAEALQRKLQAEAEAKAKAERERQEALARAQREKEEAARRAEEAARLKAAAAKNDADRKAAMAEAERRRKEAEAAAAKAAVREETAAQVFAPTVMVEAPKTKGVVVQKVWVVASINMQTFLETAATRSDLQGFVTIDLTKLARAKAAMTGMEIPGVVFEQKIR